MGRRSLAALVRRTVLVAVVLLVGVGPTLAGAELVVADADRELDGEIQILSVDEGDDSVVVEVAVPPAIGQLIPIETNFGITDGGQLVNVTVDPLPGPAEVILVLDTSGSMRGSALDAAKTAARSFIETLPPEARVGLVTFGETVVVHHEPSVERAGPLATIDGLGAADGETALWDALTAAAELVGGSETSRASVVVLSDGDDTVSSTTAAEVVERLTDRSVLLYAIGIESPETDLPALNRAVAEIGGQFLTTTDVAELDSLYVDIAGRLANRYNLRFVPAAEGERTMVVSVAIDGAVATAQTRIGSGGVATGDAPDSAAPVVPDGEPLPVLNADDAPVLGIVPPQQPLLLTGPVMLLVGLGSVFSAIAIASVLLVARPSNVRLARAASADRVAHMNARINDTANRLIANSDSKRRLDALLDAAAIDLRPAEFVMIWLLATAGLAFIGSALAGVLGAVVAVPVSILMTLAVVRLRIGRRRSRFADQLTETLGIMASGLRAGQSLPQAIELVATEAPSPTAEQFHRIHFEVRVGRDLTESMDEVATRMKSRDLAWLAQAVDIHRELGGDLTEILDTVADTIRERRMISRKIDALSAEGRMTGHVLLGMPVVLFLFSWWRTPDSIDAMLASPVGRLLLIAAASGMVIGHLWIRRLIKLEY